VSLSYKILTIDSVKKYILNIKEIKDYLENEDIEVSEIGDGNLNFVYIVTNRTNKKSLIVKQAVPYLRIAGEGFSLSRERMNYEIRALEFYSKLVPNLVPKIYYADESMSLIIMQNLSKHIIMRKGLIDTIYYPNFAEQISTFLANTLFFSSSLYLSSKEKRELIYRFNKNTELCKLTEDFVFTLAFMEDKTNDINLDLLNEAKEFFKESDYKKNILKLKYIFMTQTDALLHGDLHTGSIMLNREESFVIDPEFAFVGAFGFDIGALIANLINSYISHFYRSGNREYQEWILDTIREIYSKFESKFLELWEKYPNSALLKDGFIDKEELEEFKKEFMQNIFSQSVGFAGCKIARRVFGIAGVEDIRGIEDREKRKEAELMALRVGKRLILNYENIKSVDELISYCNDLHQSQQIANEEKKILDFLSEKDSLNPIEIRASKSSLQVLIENMIGKCKKILKEFNCPIIPQRGRDGLFILYEVGAIDTETYSNLVGAIGFRNSMIHDYMQFREDILIDIVKSKKYIDIYNFVVSKPQYSSVVLQRIENFSF